MKRNIKLCIFLLAAMLLPAACNNSGNGGQAVVTATPTPGVQVTATPTPALIQEIQAEHEDGVYEFEIKNDGEATEGMKFVKNLGIGWNLGNTFDAFVDDHPEAEDLWYETCWQEDVTTREHIALVKKEGFTSIRIPVSWHNHVTGDDFKINEAWMNRVKEVVDWSLEEGLYVIINTHHDVYPEFYYPSNEYLDNSLKYVTSIWKQVSEKFADYDNRLIFESLNEPRLKDNANEWNPNTKNAAVREAVECINKMNQAFVDTVRASGKNNAERFLLVPGYDAAPDGVLNDYFVLPADSATDRLIISVHAYTPYNFCLQAESESGSIRDFDASESSSTKDVDYFMDRLYDKFTSKNIPVLIGEFGARDKSMNTESRRQWAGYYVAKARSLGMSCMWWDNNCFVTGTGEDLGLLDRFLNVWRYKEIIDAMMLNCK